MCLLCLFVSEVLVSSVTRRLVGYCQIKNGQVLYALFWKCLYVSVFVSSACLIQFLIKYCSLTTILIFLMFSRTQPKTVFAEVEPEDDETDKPEWKKRKIWKIISLKNHFRAFETKWNIYFFIWDSGPEFESKCYFN